MKAQESTLDLKILAGLGALAFLATIFIVPIMIGYFLLQSDFTLEPDSTSQGIVSTSTTIGEAGDVCGGDERLPCKPGLMCTGGFCMKAGTTQLLHRAGESCVNAPCAIGLYCKEKICATIDATAPYVTSVKIEGATFEDSVYRIKANTNATVTLQTVNAASVTMILSAKGGTLSKAKNQTGGVYTSTLKLPADYEGKIDITVTSASQDTSYLSVDVASAK